MWQKQNLWRKWSLGHGDGHGKGNASSATATATASVPNRRAAARHNRILLRNG